MEYEPLKLEDLSFSQGDPFYFDPSVIRQLAERLAQVRLPRRRAAERQKTESSGA